MAGIVEVLQFPNDVHDDVLSAYLLWNAVSLFYGWCTGQSPPAAIGLLPWNDLIAWAQQRLPAHLMMELHCYADRLDLHYAFRVHASLPLPTFEDPTRSSRAERMAQHLLESGACTLWGAARQVVAALVLELPRHAFAKAWSQGSSMTFGVYGKGPFTGLCRQTLTHSNTIRLLNQLLLRICPHHHWSTITVLHNYRTPVHLDRQNGPEPNLLMSLSFHEQGEIWIEGEDGREFVDCDEGMVRGERHSLNLQAIRFEAHRYRHCTCDWSGTDRVMLAAYTVNRWEHLAGHHLEQLERLGFVLPPRRMVHQPGLHHDRIPTVLRDGFV
ncbi:unnamed protein product [Symbiodinium sp. CCMP2592]|nr:unnamed protein product [Symbiodinium sp. CCMP2592]